VLNKYRNPWGTGITDYTGTAYQKIEVYEGMVLTIKAKAGTNIRPYVIVNASEAVTRAYPSETWTTSHNYDVSVTIQSGEKYVYVNTLDKDYFGIRLTGTYPAYGVVNYKPQSINGDALKDGSVPISALEESPTAKSPLYGKTAVFDGDSICAGEAGIDSSNPKWRWGWAGRIGTKNSMTWKNYGISGGTVTSETYSWTAFNGVPDWGNVDYYTSKGSAQATDVIDQYVLMTSETWDGEKQLYTKGSARHWESSNIATMKSEYPSADYVILEACFNDGFNGVPKGSISAGYTGTFSLYAYCSAFEGMLQSAITEFPSAKIGVIIPYRPSGDIEAYQDLALEICQKWAIPVIDLRDKSGLVVQNDTQKAIMFYDNTHVSQNGYDFITPKIEKWMESL
jgi:lysophospholipase L1-like esterase